MKNLELLNFGKKYVGCILLVIAFWLSNDSLSAQSISSVGSGDWSNAATWVGGVIPGSADDVIINNTHTVTVSDARAAAFIDVKATGTLTISLSGTLDISGTGTYGIFNRGYTDNSGSITINNSSTYGIFSSGTFDNAGTITIGNIAASGFLGIFVDNTIPVLFNNLPGGIINIDRVTSKGINMRGNSAVFTNEGTINIGGDSGAPAISNGMGYESGAVSSFVNESTGIVNVDNCSSSGFTTWAGSITNSGEMNFGANSSIGNTGILSRGPLVNNVGGTINVDNCNQNGITMQTTATGSSNAGTINIGQIASTGTTGLRADMTFPNTGNINIDGATTSPLAGVGIINNTGNVTIGQNGPTSTDLFSVDFNNNTGGNLIGTGEVSTFDITHNGGTISPEYNTIGSIYGIQTYKFSSTVVFDGTYNCDIGGTMTPGVDFDQVVMNDANSTADISNMDLVLNITHTPASGDLIQIWDGANITGTFASVTGLTGGLQVAYDVPEVGDISLVIPEPATALNFDGMDDHTDVSVPELPQGSAPRTVEAWIRTTQTGTGDIVTWGVNSSSQRNSLVVQSGKFKFLGWFNDLAGTTTINDGIWHHVAMTYDGTTMNLYVDGVLDASGTKTLNTNGTTLIMGASPVISEYFNGDMDEVRIWTYSRSLAEITANKDCELDGTQCGLTIYHNFNQGTTFSNNTSITVVNELVSGTDATLMNFASTGGTSNWTSGSDNGVSGSCAADPCGPASALNFDGVDDYTEVPITTLPQGSAPRSVEAWVKTTQTSIGNIVSWGTTSTSQRNSIAVRTGKFAFIGTFNDLTGTIPINDGLWHHVAMSFDGVTMSLYVDGVLDVSQAKTLNTTGTSLIMGKNASPSNNEYFKGDIDEVRIWGYGRSLAEITANKDCELDGTQCGLMVYHQFNQGITFGDNTSITVVNELVNNNDASMMNFASIGGAGNWVDGSGNGVSGSCAADPCDPATALNFDGSQDFIDVPSATGLPQSNEARTVEAWVRTTQTTIGDIVSWGSGGTSQRNSIAVRSGNFAFIGAFNDLTGTIPINDGLWHHVAMTYDGVTMSLYVDGVLDVSQAKTINTTGDGLVLGKILSGGNSEYFNGDMDEVRIWNFAQCAADIAGNNGCELAGTETGLIAYYDFNQGDVYGNNNSEDIATDNSQNGYDGDLTNFTLNGAVSNWSDGSGNGVTGSCGAATCSAEIDVQGNMVSIVDGDTTPDVIDDTDFGSSALGTPITKTFSIENTGDLTLNITGPVTISNATDFSVTQPTSLVILPMSSTTFTVTYNALTVGTQTGTINIPNNDSNEDPYDFVVQGAILSPEIDVLGNSLSIVDGDTSPDLADDTDFGNTTGGNTITKTYTIENTGAATLNITGSITVDNTTDFSVTQPAITVLAPMATTTFTVTYNTLSPGTQTAVVDIPNDDLDKNPYDFTIQGNATGPFTFCVSNLNDSGAGSLRQAILDANSSAGEDTITFCIDGTITPSTDLPDITEGVFIDGTSAPSYVVGTPTVTIERASSGDINSFALTAVLATNFVVQGLEFSGPGSRGIYLNTCTDPIVTDNLILNRDLGIQASTGSGVTITNNDFTGSGSNANRSAISLNANTVTDISSNIYGGTGVTALLLNNMTNLTIGNTVGNDIVFENSSGLGDMGGGTSGNEPVMYIENSSGILIDGVELSSNTGAFTGEGIIFANCTGSMTVTNCDIQFRNRGIHAFGGSADFTITNNNVSNSGWIFNSPAININGVNSISMSGNTFGGISATALNISNMPNLTVGSNTGDIILEDGMGLGNVANGNNPVLLFNTCLNLAIDDVDVSQVGASSLEGMGITVQGGTGTCSITDCDVEYRIRAFDIAGGDFTLTGNNLTNSGQQAVHGAIVLTNLTGITAHTNVFGGIGATALSINDMTGVTFGSTGAFDILLENTSGINNLASGSEPVLYLKNTTGCTIDGIDFSSNTASVGVGIAFNSGADNNTVQNCLFNERQYGIEAQLTSTGNIITCNTFTNGVTGILLTGSASFMTCEDNIFGCHSAFGISNSSSVTLAAENNFWQEVTGPGNLAGTGMPFTGSVTAVPFLTAIPGCAPDGLPYCSDLDDPIITIEGNGVLITNGDTSPDPVDDTDFGSTILGTTVTKTFTIENTGGLVLNITGAITVNNVTDFTVTQPSTTSIAPMTSTTFSITYNALSVGTQTAIVVVPNDDFDDNPYVFTIEGTAIGVPEIEVQGGAPLVTITNGSITPNIADGTDFGALCLNESFVQTFTINNNGILDLNISNIISGNPDFTILNIPSIVPAGMTATFDIEFLASAVGSEASTISISSDDPDDNPFTFDVQVLVNSLPILTDIFPEVCEDVEGGGVATAVDLNALETSIGETGGNWYDATGAFVNTPGNATVNSSTNPFSYIFIDGNICLDTASVTFTINTIPSVTATGGELTCATPNLMLNSTTSATVPDYLWTAGAGGNLVSGSTTATAIVDAPATYQLVVNDLANGCSNSIMTTVTQDITPPTAIVNPTNGELNCNTTSFNLDASSSSGQGTLSFLWDDGPASTTANITVTTPATFTVLVTDSDNGCTAAASSNITQDVAAPIAVINPSDPELTCTVTSIDLDASSSTGQGTLTYVWDDVASSTTPLITVTTPGTYTVTITDSDNGCTDTESYVVNSTGTPPVAMIAPPTSTEINCNVTSIVLDASVSTGSGTLTYLWNDPAASTTASITVTAGATYSVTVTLGGCTDVASIVIGEDVAAPTADIFSDFKTEINCDTTSITLDATGSTGQGALTYLWSTTETTSTIVVSTGNLYEVTVTDPDNGCTNNTSLLITENVSMPTASLTSTATELNCNVPSITLDASGSTGAGALSYAWNTGETTASIVVTTPGAYSVTVTDMGSLCESVENVTITENITAPTATIDSGGQTELNCNTTSIVLDASSSTGQGSLTYLWSTGATTSSINVSTDGNYSVVVTDDANGCTATSAITITEDVAAPTADIFSDFKEEINCDTTSITLDASGSTGQGALTYAWSTAETTPSIVVTTGALYEVTVTDPDNGCTNNTSLLITENVSMPTTSLTSTATELNCNVPSITLDASGSTGAGTLIYNWSTGETTPSIVVTTPNTYSVTVTDAGSLCQSFEMVTITENVAAPTATIDSGGQTELNCTTTSIVLDASSSTGQGTLTYLWSTGATTSSINVSTDGNYSVVVTDDANGCTATSAITITENVATPTADLFSDFKEEINCDTTSIILDASGSTGQGTLTYLWSTGETTPMIVVTAQNFYEVTVTDSANGCTDVAGIVITESTNLPTVVLTSNNQTELNCDVSSIILDASGSSGTGPITFEWSTGSTASSIVVTTPGTYTVTVTEVGNSCENVELIIITENVTAPTATIDSGGQSELNCSTTSIVLDASSSTGQGTLTYLWSTGLTASSINVSTIGTYVVDVMDDANGCTGTTSIEITEDLLAPTVDLFSDFKEELNCDTTSITLDASSSTGQGALTFAWSTNETTPTIVITTDDFYEVTVTDTDNGCTAIEGIVITESTNPPTATIDSGGQTEINCNAPSITLDASGSSGNNGVEYEWSTGETTASIVVMTQGTYDLTITDIQNRCQDFATIEITENSTAPVAVLTQSAIVLNCDTLSINLDASSSTSGGAATYLWSTGETTPMIDVMVAGTYDVVVTDPANGCTSTASTTISGNSTAPVVNISPSHLTLTCDTTLITLDASGSTGQGNLNFLWSTGQTASSIDVSIADTYSLMITDNSNGCDATSSTTVVQDPTFLPITLTASDLEICEGENVIFTADGGTDYEFFVNGISVQGPGSQDTYSNANLNNNDVVTVESVSSGCSNGSAPITMVVFALPSANLTASNTTICLGDNVDFTATGGVEYEFLLNGNIAKARSIDDTFSSTILNDGDEVTVNVFNSNDCSQVSNSIAVVVNNLPPAQINGLDIICEGDLIEFEGAGGVEYEFVLNGNIVQPKSTNTFYSNSTLNTGDMIYVEVTDVNGCVAQSPPITMAVSPIPMVSFDQPVALCAGLGSQTIVSNASPVGGAFSGIGVTDNGNGIDYDFDTSLGEGIYTITYTYDNGNGCIVDVSQDLTILPQDNITFTQPAALCSNDAPIPLTATPAGGVFDGIGVSGNQFDPTISGPGTFDVTYSTLSGNGCTSEEMVQVTVNPLPTLGLVSFACATDLQSYEAIIQSNTSNLIISEGTLVDNLDGTYTISGISTMNVLNIEANLAGCTDVLDVNPPNCSCPLVPEPTSLGDVASCSGEPIPNLNVTVASNFTVDWYDAAVGGTLLLANSEIYAATSAGTYYAEARDAANNCVSSVRTPVQLNILNSPTVSFTDPTDVCENVGLISLTGIPANGTFTGMGVTDMQFDPTIGAGTYTLTYTFTDTNGCEGEESQEVEVFEAPTIDFTDPSDACLNAGNLIPLVATPAGGTFTAPIGVLGNDFDPASSGVGVFDITYTVSNTTGCTSTATQNIEVFLEPSIAVTDPGVICIDQGVVTLMATPANGTFTGIGITGNDFDPTVAGVGVHPINYSFSSSAGCSKDSTFNITVSGLPTPVIGGLTSYCEGETLTIVENSETAATWSWTGPNTFASSDSLITINNFSNNEVGNYAVVATNTNGCSQSANVDVTLKASPTISITGNAPTCAGEQLDIAETGGEASTWNWIGPNAFTQNSSMISLVDVNTSLNGTYYVSGENAQGCTYLDSFVVVINELPTIDLLTNGPICENADLELSETSGAGTTYSWIGPDGFTSNSGNPIITGAVPTNTGNYILTVTDFNNCQNTDSIVATVNANPNVQISTSSPICNDENLEMTEIGGTATQWTWTSPDAQTFTTQDFIIPSGQVPLGDWSVVATDANGCVGSDQVNVTRAIGEDIETQFLVGDMACAGDTLIFLDYSVVNDLGLASFNWDFGNGRTSNARDAQLVYTTPGLYNISVDIVSGNCPNVSIQKQIEIISCLKDEESLQAELNPTINSGSFNVKAEMWVASDLTISILDLSGTLIESRFLQNVEEVDEPFSLPRSGTYFVHLRHWDGTAVLRTIVVKE